MISSTTHLVVLDVDDTLYLERDYVLSGFRAVGRHVERELAIVGFAEVAEKLFNAGARGTIFNQALAEFDITATPALVATLVEVYREHKPAIALQPDASGFIERNRRGRALAALTDGYLAAQRNKVASLQLQERGLTPIVCTDIWGRAYWKPHPRGFESLQAHYGVRSCACTYIADNPAKDFVAPRKLGWRTIQIVRENGMHSPVPPTPAHAADRVVTSLDEILDEDIDDTAVLTAG